MANVIINDANLVAIGDAIRAKNGTANTYKPREMADAITNLPTGGGGADIEPIVITGEQTYACAGYLGGQYIERFGNTISVVDLTNAGQFFYNTSAKSIPFSINFKPGTTATLNQMFYLASELETMPVVNYAKPVNLASFCSGCKKLIEIPENWVDNWDLEDCHNNTSYNMSSMFSSCVSLRKIPSSVLKQLYHKKASYSNNSMYSQTFQYCYNLDEIRDLNIAIGPHTSNMLAGTVAYASCLKSFTFAMNDDGTPKIAEWKSQVLTFENVGYDEMTYTFYERDRNCYSSGRTINDCIYDDATYQLNKNNPNAYVAGYKAENPVQYSLYNHDSAVETINSLPDCSAYLATAGGTNTIKFKGQAGSATDGGAINTLTEEEIAVATVKGWTVSFV